MPPAEMGANEDVIAEPPAPFPANSGITSDIASSGCIDQELDHSTPISPESSLVVRIRRESWVT